MPLYSRSMQGRRYFSAVIGNVCTQRLNEPIEFEFVVAVTIANEADFCVFSTADAVSLTESERQNEAMQKIIDFYLAAHFCAWWSLEHQKLHWLTSMPVKSNGSFQTRWP